MIAYPVGMKVRHIEMPGRTGVVLEHVNGSSVVKVRWPDATVWHDIGFIREDIAYIEPPKAAACRCPIKDLLSDTGHGKDCPEKRR